MLSAPVSCGGHADTGPDCAFVHAAVGEGLLAQRPAGVIAKGRRSRGPLAGRGGGASGATSTDALYEGRAQSDAVRTAQERVIGPLHRSMPAAFRVPGIPAYSWRGVRPGGCDAAPWRHDVSQPLTLSWYRGGLLASSKS